MLGFLNIFFNPKAVLIKERYKLRREREQNRTRAYAVKLDYASPWTKAVVRGYVRESSLGVVGKVMGPFRSEIDCEEFCDHQNINDPFSFFNPPKLYQPQNFAKK